MEPSVSGWKKRTSGSWADRTFREEARRGGYHKGEGDIARIQLEGARAQLQQHIARSRYEVDVVDKNDNGSIVPPR